MLTDTEIKKAKAKSKSYKLTDGNGLILEVTPKGKKRWRCRRLVKQGIHPVVDKNNTQVRKRLESDKEASTPKP